MLDPCVASIAAILASWFMFHWGNTVEANDGNWLMWTDLNNFVWWVLTNTHTHTQIFILHAHCHMSIHVTESQPSYSWFSDLFPCISLTSCPGYSMLPMRPYLFSTWISSLSNRESKWRGAIPKALAIGRILSHYHYLSLSLKVVSPHTKPAHL